MRKYLKNKKGFSLVEMVLAIAIIVLIGGVIAGICASISNSFVTTYNIDDAADYAMLYARGFENSFLAYSQSKATSGASWKWYIENPKGLGGDVPTLVTELADGSTEAVFTPEFLTKGSSSDSKWAISMFFKYDETNKIIRYRVFLRDNYDNNYVSRYDGSFWMPRFEDCAEQDLVGSSRTVELTGDPLTENTMITKYGYSPEAWAAISSAEDSGYNDRIVFYWGT